jgi:hypothetical protein
MNTQVDPLDARSMEMRYGWCRMLKETMAAAG